MQFDVEAEPFGGVGNLHDPGDAAVVVGIDAHEVGSVGHDEIHVRLQPPQVFQLQERRLDELAQFPVGESRDPTVAERVLVPEIVKLVAGPAQFQGVAEGLDGAEGIQHQIHPVPHSPAHGPDQLDLVLQRGRPASRGS